MNNNNLTKIERMRLAKEIVAGFNIKEFNSFIIQQKNLNDKKKVINDYIKELFRITYSKLTIHLGNNASNQNIIVSEIRELQSEISQTLFIKFDEQISSIKDENKLIQESYSLFFLEYDKNPFDKFLVKNNPKIIKDNNKNKTNIDDIKKSMNETIFNQKSDNIIKSNSPKKISNKVNQTNFEENKNTYAEQTKVPFYKYVIAWFVFNISHNILHYSFNYLLVNFGNFRDSYYADFSIYTFIIPIFNALSLLASFIFISEIFKTLIIKKVIPYIWVFTGLGFFAALGNQLLVIKQSYHSEFMILYLTGFIMGMIGIHFYSTKNKNLDIGEFILSENKEDKFLRNKFFVIWSGCITLMCGLIFPNAWIYVIIALLFLSYLYFEQNQ